MLTNPYLEERRRLFFSVQKKGHDCRKAIKHMLVDPNA
jgi:hypothetical protein